MLADLFESGEMVKVVDFLLDQPDWQFNKSGIADGAGISRPTLYKIWPRLVELGLVVEGASNGGVSSYRLNSESALVRLLLRFDNELSRAMAKAGVATPEPGPEVTVGAPGKGRSRAPPER